jgi:nicotinate-nucleotide pyrophosphorylase (carboxylating)
VIAAIEGPARGLLTGERTALNFLCHLSGVATATASLVSAAQGTKARIVCTRKTTPGLRRWKNTRSAPAAAAITVSASTTPS